MPQNLLEPTWTDLDRDELRLLLGQRFDGGLGQYDGDDNKLYLPAAGGSARIVLNFADSNIATVEPGMPFDAAEWERVREEIEHSLLTGVPKVGRYYSFSSFPVQGSWRGARSGMQILPAPKGTPRYAGGHDPFILEFPIRDGGLFFITNHRRLREHRKLTLLLNVLLAGRTSCLPLRHGHFWAIVPPEDGKPFPENIKWVEEGYDGPLDAIVLDEHTPPSDARIEEVDPEEYYTNVGNDSLRVPADLDVQICGYLGLPPDHREKFDRAAFWFDMSSRQFTVSVSAAFGALVSAIEALTECSDIHHFDCPICGKHTRHEVPGATRRFRDFIDTYAPDVGTGRRGKLYPLRSGVFHGSKLIEIDYALAFGWDPPWWNQREMHWDLWKITRVALRNWLERHAATASRMDRTAP